MKIASITTYPVRIPLRASYETAEIGNMPNETVLVKICTDDGLVGYGESKSFFWYKEPFEVIVINIEKYLSKALLGANPFDVESIAAQMDIIMPDQPAAKAGIITALYDIMGKALEVPTCMLLGGFIREQIPAAMGIPFGQPEEVANRALEWAEKGVQAFKIKIGREGRNGSLEDLKAVKLIRHSVGPEVSLRVDSNESYGNKLGVLRKMEDFDLDLIEQPVPRGALRQMREFREALDTPLLADQSIFGIEDAVRVIEEKAADVLMVKNYVLGGLRRCKQLLAIIEAHHKANYLEASVETGVGTAATLHLAASTARVDYWGCLSGPLLLVDDLLEEPLCFQNGCWLVPDKPGLGVEVDEEKLKFRLVR